MKIVALNNWVLSGKQLGAEEGGLRHRIRRILDYAMVAPLLLAAFGLSCALSPVVYDEPLFIIYVVASLGAAWYGGLGPGIVCLVAGIFMVDFFFTGPTHEFGPYTPKFMALIILNAAAGAVGLAAIFNLQLARYRERQAHFLTSQLEHEIEKHRETLKELTAAKSQLDKHAENLERRVAERTAKLRESVQSLEGVLYHVAHDLRSPLRSLSGFSVLLMESLGPRLNMEEKFSMEKIIKSSARMDRLILDLLGYGKMAQANPVLRETDLDALAFQVLERLGKEIRSKQANVELARPLLAAKTDPGLLSRAIMELLRNSLEFAAPGIPPHISIWTEPHGSHVRLFVKDNGIGIDLTHQKRIFQVFERLHPSEASSGTGIGLAMVAKIMERLGGKVGIESELGKGSRFWLELPTT